MGTQKNRLIETVKTDGLENIHNFTLNRYLPFYVMLQHQLFWMNEKEQKAPDYWKQSNFANCLLDMLIDTERILKGGKLVNYFDERINILAGKERAFLNSVAEFLHQKWDALMHI